MATNYPYTSAQGALVKAFEQFRKSFPPVVDAALLKRFNIAPANESYIINTFRFLGLIDDDGKKVDEVAEIFFHGENAFQSGLEALVSKAYADLFAEHGDSAWTESKSVLATWFRVKDKTSDLIGGRQAATFLTLAALAGHGEPVKAPTSPSQASGRGKAKDKAAQKPPAKQTTSAAKPSATQVAAPTGAEPVGLTVRIEVNLPAGGTPEVYDAIFASIRRNLIDRE